LQDDYNINIVLLGKKQGTRNGSQKSHTMRILGLARQTKERSLGFLGKEMIKSLAETLQGGTT